MVVVTPEHAQLLAEEALHACEAAEALARIPTSIKNRRLVPCPNILLNDESGGMVNEVNNSANTRRKRMNSSLQLCEEYLANGGGDSTGSVERRESLEHSNSSSGSSDAPPPQCHSNEVSMSLTVRGGLSMNEPAETSTENAIVDSRGDGFESAPWFDPAAEAESPLTPVEWSNDMDKLLMTWEGSDEEAPVDRMKSKRKTTTCDDLGMLCCFHDSNLFLLLMQSLCAAAPAILLVDRWGRSHWDWKRRSRNTFESMCTLATLGSASRVLRLVTASGIEELRTQLQASLRKEFVPFSPITHFNSVGSGFGLCHFAEQGDIMKCREYIAAGADVNFEDDVEFKSDGTAPFGVRVGKEYWAASRTPLSCAYAAASSTVIRLLLACGAAPDICLGSGWEDIHFEDKCKELQETCRGRMLRVSVGHPTWGITRPLRLGHQNEVFVSEAGGKVMTLKEHIARREQGNLESMWQWACDVRGVKNEKLLQLVRKTSEEWRTEAEVTRNGNRYTQWQELHRHPLE